MRRLTSVFVLLVCGFAYGSARDPSNFFYRVSPASTPLKIEPVYYAPKPEYPAKAIKNHFEGAGLFEIRIRPDGNVQSVKVIKTIGYPVLDQAAIATFRRWNFRPHSIGLVRVPIEYTLRGPPPASGRHLKDLGDGDSVVVWAKYPPR